MAVRSRILSNRSEFHDRCRNDPGDIARERAHSDLSGYSHEELARILEVGIKEVCIYLLVVESPIPRVMP